MTSTEIFMGLKLQTDIGVCKCTKGFIQLFLKVENQND